MRKGDTYGIGRAKSDKAIGNTTKVAGACDMERNTMSE